MLTGDDVRARRFIPTKYREGYAVEEVDALLARVAEALDDVGAGRAPAITGPDVLNAKFAATKFRAGYDQDEVDNFLDEVVRSLGAATAEPLDAPGLRRAFAELRAGRMQPGYEPSAVAAFVERLAADLDLRRHGLRGSMSAEEAATATFPGTWWQPGLPRGAVLALLDRAAASLR